MGGVWSSGDRGGSCGGVRSVQMGGASGGGVVGVGRGFVGVGAGQWWGWRKVGKMGGGLVVW